MEASASRALPFERWSTDRKLPTGFVISGIALGVGLGGFVDGIVLHQVLQWHHMLTATGHHPANTVAGLETNTLWDGLFHSLTWVATVCGLYGLWISAPIHRPGWGTALIGLLVIGWGAFNLVEGVIDHHVLGLHNVRDDVSNPMPWNVGFLVFGAALVAVGYALVRKGQSVGGVGDREIEAAAS